MNLSKLLSMLLAEISYFEKNYSKFKKNTNVQVLFFRILQKLVSFFFQSELRIVKDIFNLILNYQLNKLNLQSFQDFDIDSINQISCYNNINAQILLFIRIYLLLFMRAHLCSKIKGRTKKQKYIKTLKLNSKRFVLVQDNNFIPLS